MTTSPDWVKDRIFEETQQSECYAGSLTPLTPAAHNYMQTGSWYDTPDDDGYVDSDESPPGYVDSDESPPLSDADDLESDDESPPCILLKLCIGSAYGLSMSPLQTALHLHRLPACCYVTAL